jgi:galactan 5-O-arabinofuranosyltransferase
VVSGAGLRALGEAAVVTARRARSRDWTWSAAEIAVILATAAATAAVAHAVIAAANTDARSAVAPAFGPLWAALMILLAVGAHVAQRRSANAVRSRMLVAVLAGAAVGVVMTPLMAGLHGTNQPPNTILGGDMAFHTEYVTRFSATWHLQDYTFRGLHAFYPPAWFWLAGRAAHVLDIPAWEIVKPFTIITIGAALLLAYALWRIVLTPAGALSAAIGSSLVLTTQKGQFAYATQAWYSPHSCFVAVTGVAWLAATLHAVRGGGTRGRLVLLALVGTVLALCYYLLFILAVLVLVVLAAAPSAGRRETMLRVGAVCGGVALLSAPFWVPLAGAVLHGAASQGHFVRPDFLRVSVGLDGPLALSLLAGVSIVMLALTFSSPASQAVAGLLVGTVLYQLASVTSLLVAHNQLQPHRAVTMMWAAFGAALPVALEGLRSRGGSMTMLPPALLRRLGTTLLALSLPAIFVLGAAQGSDLAAGPYSRAAYKRPNLAPAKAMTSFISRVSGKRPQRLTVLTGYRPILVTEPFYGFLPLRARYAHPEAHLSQRIAVLRAAAACPDSACATARLTRSRFGAIDAMVLARTPGGYRVQTQADGFPNARPVTIAFPANSFAPSAWTSHDFGPYTAFARPRAR